MSQDVMGVGAIQRIGVVLGLHNVKTNQEAWPVIYPTIRQDFGMYKYRCTCFHESGNLGQAVYIAFEVLRTLLPLVDD